jgi:hypothetical protein
VDALVGISKIDGSRGIISEDCVAQAALDERRLI